MKKSVSLPIMVYTPEQLEQSENELDYDRLGIPNPNEVSEEEYDVSHFNFYNIDVIFPRVSNPEQTIVAVGGVDYICLLPWDVTKKEIEKAFL